MGFMEDKMDPHSPWEKDDKWEEYKYLVQQRKIETEQKLKEHKSNYAKIKQKLYSMGRTV